jgi:succinyl-CoA synthetase beta subunit
MKVHEYQAKQILARYGIPVPRGEVAATPDEARAAAGRLGGRVVLKAQVHAGGRGRAGGIRTAASPAEAERLAHEMIGMTLVTPQTGPAGKTVRKLLVEEAAEVARELYLGLAVDRAREAVVVMASAEGGVEIEALAAAKPEAIIKEYIHPAAGLRPFQARALAFGLGLGGDVHNQAAKAIAGLAAAFAATDASLAEVNPLAVTSSGTLLALDAKMNFDDNALPRHPDVQALRDRGEELPLEVEASEHNLNYVKLDGDVGCMVNGAGLAMATMDIIRHAGGRPANFLDVGGGVSEEAVSHAFRILVCDPDVRAALINIFGGIVRCDLIAAGVVKAARDLGTRLPVVIRLEGTNAEEGRRILRESGLAFHPADGMKEAAAQAVALAR